MNELPERTDQRTTIGMITDIQIYWDSDGENDSGWAFDARNAQGRTTSGRFCGIAFEALDEAIIETCRVLNVDLPPQAFIRESVENCGYVVWSDHTSLFERR